MLACTRLRVQFKSRWRFIACCPLRRRAPRYIWLGFAAKDDASVQAKIHEECRSNPK